MQRTLRAMLAVCTLLVALGPGAQPSFADDPPVNVTSLIDGLTVQQVGFYKERTSVLDVYGEISNQSDRALSNLGVFVELYNDAGERLARGAAPAISVNILKPGEKTVWFVFMSDHPASWARMEVKVGTFGGSLQESIDLDYPDLTLTDVSAMPAPNIAGAIEVKGTVTNTGSGIGRARAERGLINLLAVDRVCVSDTHGRSCCCHQS